jgi:hypothetical protein
MLPSDPSNPSWGRMTASQRHHLRRALIVRRVRAMIARGVLPDPAKDDEE